MKVEVYITLKQGVHDPQGEAVLGTLKHLGFQAVEEVRVGKYIELDLSGLSREEISPQVKAMCDKLLANPVIESYSFKIE